MDTKKDDAPNYSSNIHIIHLHHKVELIHRQSDGVGEVSYEKQQRGVHEIVELSENRQQIIMLAIEEQHFG